MSAIIHEHRTCWGCGHKWEIVFISLFTRRADGLKIFSTHDSPVYLNGVIDDSPDYDCPKCSSTEVDLIRNAKDISEGSIVVWDDQSA